MLKMNRKANQEFTNIVHKEANKGVLLQQGNRWMIIYQAQGIYATHSHAYFMTRGVASNPEIGQKDYVSREEAYGQLTRALSVGWKVKANTNSIPSLLALIEAKPRKKLIAIHQRISYVEISTKKITKSMKAAVHIKFYQAGAARDFKIYMYKRIQPDGVHLREFKAKDVRIRLEPNSKAEALKMIYYLENELTNFLNDYPSYRVGMEVDAYSC